jgi:predicted Zn-dependent peptidase
VTFIPQVAPARPIRLPAHETEAVRGLKVIAIRKPSVPRFELRLSVPGGYTSAPSPAKPFLLAQTLLQGTSSRTAVDIAKDLQNLGATLGAFGGLDDMTIAGGGLAASLPGFLELLAEVVQSPSFPSPDVEATRDRLAQELVMRRSQPAWIAYDAFVSRLWGASHPYGRSPSPEAVGRLGPASLRSFHASRVVRSGSVLVIVGDIRPDAAIGRIVQALSGWKGGRAPAPSPPRPRTGVSLRLVDRPRAVQTNIRLGGPVVPREHPDAAALVVASTIFGGYFSSRLVENLRERRGYTYSPGSFVDHGKRLASNLTIAADVATEVTAPALVEILYELNRLATAPVDEDEIESAARYLRGSYARAIQTQLGLATTVANLAAGGLGIEYIRRIEAAIGRVDAGDVQRVAAAYFSPRRLVAVLVGDAARIRGPLEAIADVELRADGA